VSVPRHLPWFTAAAVIGTVHALYWALGGEVLVETVGAWPVQWRRESPVAVGLALAVGLWRTRRRRPGGAMRSGAHPSSRATSAEV
jgi:hypothetical protein